ncbi:hypothetical protein Tco_0745090 [Tanacetum coccineum]
MAAFPCLEELSVLANYRSSFNGMLVYLEREKATDIEFATDLHNLWVQFIDRINDSKLFISELEGVPPSLMSYNCYGDDDVGLYILWFYVHGDDDVGAWPGHEMSFATKPKPDREAMWVHCQMHHSRMGHTTTNRGLAATGTMSLVVGQGLGKGNTTKPVRGDYLIGLVVRSTTTTGLAGGSVATGSIIVPEVIDDCMSPQCTDSSENKTEPPAAHGTRSPTSKSLTN